MLFRSLLPLIFLLLAGCATVNKYANMRFYQSYRVDNLSRCDYKLKFQDCSYTNKVHIAIADDDSWIVLSEGDNPRELYGLITFHRDRYQQNIAPFKEFIRWQQGDKTREKLIVEQRTNDNRHFMLVSGNRTYRYTARLNRNDEPVLILQIGEASPVAYSPEQARRVIEVTEQWYNHTLEKVPM